VEVKLAGAESPSALVMLYATLPAATCPAKPRASILSIRAVTEQTMKVLGICASFTKSGRAEAAVERG
jgi:hypothetical protein